MFKHRYNEFAVVFRLWVYLRHVRHGGGAHVVGRVNGLTPGSLTIDCPACPQPSKNLVTDSTTRLLSLLSSMCAVHLANRPPFSWINTLYLSLDANFKLKQKDRGFADPLLANGLSYMIADGTLKKHLAECDQKRLNQDVSATCVPPLVSAHENSVRIRSTPVGPRSTL